jgi:hypothetical protein
MTTFDDANPSLSQFLFWKLGKALSKRDKAKTREGTRAYTWVQVIVRLMAQLAGLGSLTLAGFTVNITAGLIVAGISFFILSWLSTGQPSTKDSDNTRR